MRIRPAADKPVEMTAMLESDFFPLAFNQDGRVVKVLDL